jgi:hypothetical protein
MRLPKQLIIGFSVSLLLCVGALLFVFLHTPTETISSPEGRIQYAIPKGWSTDFDPVDSSDLRRIYGVFFRQSTSAALPAIAFRFWDNQGGRDAQFWATQAGLEAEVQQKPQKVFIGANTFWLLSAAEGPGLLESSLFTLVAHRVLQIAIRPEFAVLESPYFTHEITNVLESISISP